MSSLNKEIIVYSIFWLRLFVIRVFLANSRNNYGTTVVCKNCRTREELDKPPKRKLWRRVRSPSERVCRIVVAIPQTIRKGLTLFQQGITGASLSWAIRDPAYLYQGQTFKLPRLRSGLVDGTFWQLRQIPWVPLKTSFRKDLWEGKFVRRLEYFVQS